MEWTRVTDPGEATRLFPAWFSGRMVGARGAFGLLLGTGDVMRITCVMALHHVPDGTALADVMLDHAGPPVGVDLAWRTKHLLGAPVPGAPVPGATLATVNLAHIAAAVEFVAAEIVEPALSPMGALGDELPQDVAGLGLTPPPDLAVVAAGWDRA